MCVVVDGLLTYCDAAQALGGEVFAQYAASQGAAVWEGLLPHAEARHAGVIARAAEVCVAA